MIKHDDTDKALNELGEFGVVRNSVYDINVNKFNNPGYPEIPTPGTDPDEEDGSFLAIQINVQSMDLVHSGRRILRSGL